MRVQVERRGEIAIVCPEEPMIDYQNASQFGRILDDLARQAPRAIVINLENVLHIDSRGLMPLLSARAALSEGGSLLICGASPQTVDSLRYMKLDQVLDIHTDLSAALEAAGSQNQKT